MTPSGLRARRLAPGAKTPGLLRAAALLVVLVWLAVAGLGGPTFGKLSGLQQNDATAFLDPTAPSSVAREQAAAFADSESLPLFLVLTREAGIERADLGSLATFTQGLADVELAEGLTLGDVVAQAPAALIPSEDGKAVLVPIALDPDRATEKVEETSVTRLVLDGVRAHATDELGPDGYGVALTGPAAYVADFSKAFAGIDGLLLIVALVVVFAILVLVYRSPFLPLAVLLSSVFGLAAAGFIVYELASRGWLSISGQSQGILSILVVGAATDYALLVVSRYREELERTPSAWEAMKRTWRGTVEPISASAATVIVGLLCLLLSDLGSTRSLGPISAVGIVAALLGALTFLPAILLLTGRRIFWPRIPRVLHAGVRTPAEAGNGPWARAARFVGAHARPVWIGATVLLLTLAAFAGTFRADGLGNNEVFRVPVDSVAGEKVLAEHFPAGASTPLTVVVPEADADRVRTALEALPAVASTSLATQAAAPASGRPGTPPAPPATKVVDGRVLVNVTLDAEGQSLAAQQAVADVRTAVQAIDPTLTVGGLTAQALDTRLANERDVRTVLPAIVAVVFLVLVLLLRSLVMPLILMAANIVSFLAAIGVSALVFNHVFKFPNSDPSTPIYAFVFLIALGIDYSIFLMTRVREEVPRLGARPAVLRGLSVTGGVITSAGVVLAATFAALFVIPLVFMAQIAFLVAVGVLIDTFIVRALLVSGLAHDLGDAAWWPGRPGGRPRPRRAVVESLPRVARDERVPDAVGAGRP